MKVSGAAAGARTPGRSKANQENNNSKANTAGHRPSIQSSALSLLNVNAICGRSTSALKNRQPVKTNPAANAVNRDLSPSSPVASTGNDNDNGNGNPTVVWKDNVVFQCEGESSVSTTDSADVNNNNNGNSPSESLSEVTSNGIRKGKEEPIHPMASNDRIPFPEVTQQPIHPSTIAVPASNL